MPRRDGTGPMGDRSMIGKGLGFCTGVNAIWYGAGFGMGLGLACRRDFRRNFEKSFAIDDNVTLKTKKELLKEQKAILEKRLEVIDKQLENL